MLTIRAEQMQAFDRASLDGFKRRLRDSLAPLLPETDLHVLVERGVADAPAFGLASERDIARFVEITGTVLGAFPDGRLPVPALAILMSTGLAPSDKLDRYEAWARSQGRRAASDA
ncbi:hypothetical protein [uncultured Massilia sp.]|uniref:hypothetical protein n=1 Tax=uncultured Massilia sp. TaxID=169973 RepID=UPI0025E2BAD7|nr:hypothetical protein [uncultured Massilia sp.]